MIVRIIKTPEGPAPTDIRKAWVGVILKVIPIPADGVEFDPFYLEKLAEEIKARLATADAFPVSREECLLLEERKQAAFKGNRGGCMVPVETALIALRQQNLIVVAEWFEKNWPNKGGWFVFGPDEYEILQIPESN